MKTTVAKRAALGEIGNKPVAGDPVQERDLLKIQERDLLKIPGANKKRSYPEEEPVPQIQVDDSMEEEEGDEEVLKIRLVPDGVVDIDAMEDQNNPQLCVEYAPAIYSYLRGVEEGLSIRKDFLHG